MAVRVVYTHTCDVCNVQLGQQHYDLKWDPKIEFPQPNFYTGFYSFDGVRYDLCAHCAAPIQMARKLIGAKHEEEPAKPVRKKGEEAVDEY